MPGFSAPSAVMTAPVGSVRLPLASRTVRFTSIRVAAQVLGREVQSAHQRRASRSVLRTEALDQKISIEQGKGPAPFFGDDAPNRYSRVPAPGVYSGRTSGGHHANRFERSDRAACERRAPTRGVARIPLVRHLRHGRQRHQLRLRQPRAVQLDRLRSRRLLRTESVLRRCSRLAAATAQAKAVTSIGHRSNAARVASAAG